MGLFKKKPPPEVRTPLGTFAYSFDVWQSKQDRSGRQFVLVCCGPIFDIAVLDLQQSFLADLDRHFNEAIAFAGKQRPWPEEYARIELESIVYDPAQPHSLRLDIDIRGPMPPIGLEVNFDLSGPVDSWWQYI